MGQEGVRKSAFTRGRSRRFHSREDGTDPAPCYCAAVGHAEERMAGIGRRQMLAGLGGAAGACAFGRLAAHAQDTAQESKVARIGVLNSISYGPIIDRLDAFLDRLEEGGFVEGKNLAIE